MRETAERPVVNSRDSKLHTSLMIGGGLFLIAASGLIAWLSPLFRYGGDKLDRPVLVLVAIMMLSGAVYLAAIAGLLRLPHGARTLAWVVGVGVVMRALLFGSTPILEDDFYRYLWDGGISANGHNPYAYIPQEILASSPDSDVPNELREMARESGVVIQRLNHRALGTVYPPVAQLGFALAHILKPWSLGALRCTLLLFDALALILTFLLLHRLGRPVHHAAIYWWNPLVVKEIVNSAHMDVMVLPFALAALLMCLGQKPIRSGFMLALGIGTKIWPVLLLPVLLRTIRTPRSRTWIAVAVTVVVLLLLAWPMFPARDLGQESGFVRYGERWEMNDALFMVVHRVADIVAKPFGSGTGERGVNIGARLLAFGLLALWIGRLSYRPIRDPMDTCTRVVLILGAAFMLSPTQFPWYYVWLVPFLALSPKPSLLLLTMMLPMYYLIFYFALRGNASVFHNGLVWVEYAPVFLLIIWEWRRAKPNSVRNRTAAATTGM